MQKLRKSLSALLAVVMLISVFSFAASAGVDPIDSAATQNIAMKLEVEHADGTAATTVEPGETVTVNVYVTAKDAAARIYGGAIQFFWDSNVYTYVEGSRTWGLSSVDNAALYAVNNTQNQYVNTVANMTTEEKAYGWNICGNFQVANAAGTVNTNASLIQAGSATPFISIKLKVSDTVADGTAASIGIPVTSIAPKNTTRMNYTYIQTWTDAATTVTQNKSKSLYIMDTIADLTVATPASGPALAKSKAQVKMTPTSATTVADAFSFRVVSSISDADWTAYFANTGVAGAATNAITKAGFVAYKGATGFDMAAAQALAKSGAAQSGDYSNATTDYIQKTSGAAASFGARIEFTSQPYDVTYVAYVEYLDSTGATQYAFYEAASTALLQTNYTTIVNNYLATFSYAG